MTLSSATAAWIAIAAAAVALCAFAATLVLWLKLRRVRSAQLVLLGGGKGDLIDFAVSLQGRIDDLHRAVDEIAAGLSRVDRRVDDCVSRTSIVRYDAYSDTGGHQSASLAFLNAARSGVVVSAIQGRDYARIYVKELDHGRAPVALSPEEQEAVERAMPESGGRPAPWASSRRRSPPARSASPSPATPMPPAAPTRSTSSP